MHNRSGGSVSHLYHPDNVKLIRSHEEWRVRRKQKLIVLSKLRESPTKFSLFQAMEAEPGLVEQQNRIHVGSCCLGKEHHEEGHQPLEPLRSLVELQVHAKRIFHHHLEVLLIRHYAYRVVRAGRRTSWPLPAQGLPDFADFVR